jgi:hypothetical protein
MGSLNRLPAVAAGASDAPRPLPALLAPRHLHLAVNSHEPTPLGRTQSERADSSAAARGSATSGRQMWLDGAVEWCRFAFTLGGRVSRLQRSVGAGALA